MSDWKSQLQLEFENAEAARARGNEGQARVCARRAAGVAVRAYYTQRGRPVRTPSAYDLLTLLEKDPQIPAHLKQAAAYLTMRVTKEFKLPVEVDLLDEARGLCRGLLGEG